MALALLLLVGCSDVAPQISLLRKGKLNPLTISGPDISVGNKDKEFTWTLTYDKSQTVVLSEEYIHVLTSGDVVCSAPKLIQDGESRKVTIGGCTGDGEVHFSIAAGSALNSLKEEMSEVDSVLAAKVDNTPPEILLMPITPFVVQGNSQSVFQWTASYWGAEDISLTRGKLQLVSDSASPVSCTLEVLPSSVGEHVKTLKASNCQGNGQYKLVIESGTAKDQAGNSISKITESDFIKVGNTKPKIDSVTGPNHSHGNSNRVFEWKVTYSDHQSMDLTDTGLTLSYSGTGVNCQKKEVLSDNGSPNSQIIRVSQCSGDGIVQVEIAEGAAKDAFGNKTEKKDLTSVVVDNTAPTLTIGDVTPTKGNSSNLFSWLVTYESDIDNVSLSSSHVEFKGALKTQDCTVSIENTSVFSQKLVQIQCSKDGTLQISISSGSASDKAGNSALAASNASIATVDSSSFTGVLASTTKSVNNSNLIPVTLTFAEAPTPNVQPGDFATTQATILNFKGGGTSYNFDLQPSQEGLVSVQLKQNVVKNGSGTNNEASNTLSFTVDRTRPILTMTEPTVKVGNKEKAFVWTVSAVDATPIVWDGTKIQLNGAATAGCVVSSSFTNSPGTVSVAGCTGDGNFSLTLNEGLAKDSAENKSAMANTSNILVDNTPPLLTVTNPGGSQASGFTWNLNFSEPIASFDAEKIVLSGVLDGCEKNTAKYSETQWTLSVKNCSATGTVALSAWKGLGQDAAGNSSAAKDIGSFSVDNSVPTLTLSDPSAILGNSAKKFEWTLTYSSSAVIESNLSSYLEMVNPGLSLGCIFGISPGTNPNERKVSVSGCSAEEAELKLKVKKDSAKSSSGVVGTPEVISNAAITIDNKKPDIEGSNIGLKNGYNGLSANGESVYGGASDMEITWMIPFEEHATLNLKASDINASYTDYSDYYTGSGSPGSQSCKVEKIDETYKSITFKISECIGDGEFKLRVPAGAVTDKAGNTSDLFEVEDSVMIVNSFPKISDIVVGEQKFGLKKPPSFTPTYNIHDQLIKKISYKIVSAVNESIVVGTSTDGHTFSDYAPVEGVQYKFIGKITSLAGKESEFKSETPWTASFCPTNSNYIDVPAAGASKRFCVAKYEMRRVDGYAISQPTGTPWVNIVRGIETYPNSGSYTGAWGECKKLGDGYNLISNDQWQQVARNIEGVRDNWVNKAMDTNDQIFAGVVGESAALSSEESQRGTGVNTRFHTLNNGQLIWDLAGNVSEWTRSRNVVNDLCGNYTFLWENQIKSEYGPYGPYNYSQRIGQPKSSGSACYSHSDGTATTRGGSHLDEMAAGIYAVNANISNPGYANSSDTGFRCVFEYP